MLCEISSTNWMGRSRQKYILLSKTRESSVSVIIKNCFFLKGHMAKKSDEKQRNFGNSMRLACMIQADKTHKEKVIEILSECFEKNKTVNWIVKQDSKRKERIKNLMEYSFEACIDAGQIYLTEDVTGVIICSNSDDKLPILEEAYLTIHFVLKVTGIEGIGRALRREKYINQFHPKDEEFIYIWFIGLEKTEQGRGVGSAMLQEVINRSNREKLPVYVETSNDRSLNFYKRHGFEMYHISPEDMFGFKLYFLRKLPETP